MPRRVGQRKMGWNATWSMAVGGMIGGGMSVLGVAMEKAGALAWLCLVIGGLIALCTAYSYAGLARKFREGGGAFEFLREIHREGLAGSLSWVLILGYVLIMSVYAFTFGHYLGEAFGLAQPVVRLSALAIVGGFVLINLVGVRQSSSAEIAIVWVELAVLLGLAAFGLSRWDSHQLGAGVESPGVVGVMVGAASVFMAYEGFQLLSYDYDDIHSPNKTLPSAVLSAVVVIIALYVTLALAAAFLVGAGMAAAVLAANLLVNAPFNLLILMGTVLIAIAARPLVLRRLGVLG
jgi:amino acid transporter